MATLVWSLTSYLGVYQLGVDTWMLHTGQSAAQGHTPSSGLAGSAVLQAGVLGSPWPCGSLALSGNLRSSRMSGGFESPGSAS